MPKVTTVLLDCDNTLVLSEDVAFNVCASLINEVLTVHGISVIPNEEVGSSGSTVVDESGSGKNMVKAYTGEGLVKEYVGQNFRGMLSQVCNKHGIRLSDEERDKWVAKELEEVIARLDREVKPCEGVLEAVANMNIRSPEIRLAVVSSSAMPRLIACLRSVGLLKTDDDKLTKTIREHADTPHPPWGVIPIDSIFSAITSLPEPTSKPNPAVYLYACEKLGVKPGECVAVEDSKSGATAAVRAGAHLIGYVGCYKEQKEREKMAIMLRECGAEVIMQHWSEFNDCLKRIAKL